MWKAIMKSAQWWLNGEIYQIVICAFRSINGVSYSLSLWTCEWAFNEMMMTIWVHKRFLMYLKRRLNQEHRSKLFSLHHIVVIIVVVVVIVGTFKNIYCKQFVILSTCSRIPSTSICTFSTLDFNFSLLLFRKIKSRVTTRHLKWLSNYSYCLQHVFS